VRSRRVCANLRFRGWGAGEGEPFPCISKYRSPAASDFSYFSAATTLPILCEWLRMKFSAGFLQWEPSEASRCYESYRQTRAVFNQNLEQRGVLCSRTNTQMSQSTWRMTSQAEMTQKLHIPAVYVIRNQSWRKTTKKGMTMTERQADRHGAC
jgi:hypothetical protein